MTFRAVLSVYQFREMIEAISALVTECRLHVNEDGLSVVTVDSANVAMVSASLSSSAFVEYAYSAPLELGLDVAKVHAILALAQRADERMTIEYDVTKKQLRLQFGGYNYRLSLIDVKTIRKDPAAPPLDLPASMELLGVLFADAVSAALLASKTSGDKQHGKVVISVDPDAQTLSITSSTDSQEIERIFRGSASGSETVKFFACALARSCYSLDYLKDMSKPINMSAGQMAIKLGIDHPMQLSWDFAAGAGKIMYLLAPRIEPA